MTQQQELPLTVPEIEIVIAIVREYHAFEGSVWCKVCGQALAHPVHRVGKP